MTRPSLALGACLLFGCITIQNAPPQATQSPAPQPAVAPGPPQEAEGPATIAELIALCRDLKTVDVELSCTTEYADDTTMMMVVFRSEAALNQYMQPVANELGRPFCDATNSANRQAMLVVGVAESRLLVPFLCEQNTWGNGLYMGEDGELINLGPVE